MNTGEAQVKVGDSPSLGPTRIDVYQPLPSVRVRERTPTELLLETLIAEVRSLNAKADLMLLELQTISNFTTPLWRRLYLWVKRHVARSR